MNKRKRNILAVAAICAALAFALAGCGTKSAGTNDATIAFGSSSAESGSTQAVSQTSSDAETDNTEYFTSRDLEQTADLSNAETITVADGQTITIDTEGVYVLTGTASNAQVVVDAADEAKVQLVLDGISITNETIPCIYVKNADKVFVTTTDSKNALTVSGTFSTDGDTKTDAVIFSKDDLVLNGVGTLTISSSDNAVSSKDDLKVTGGTYEISCSGTALEAHELIAVADGTVQIASCNDGLHAENDEDDSVGEIYLQGGTFTINAADDGIHATTTFTIDGGSVDMKAAEGIEATVVKINDGTIQIEASDDGINASQKSSALSVLAEFNGGKTTIVMGAGDTDAVDSNGDLIINGGTLDITAQSPFDYDGTAQKNGGTIIVNGQETDTISNQFGGGPGGGPAGGMPDGSQGGFDGKNGGPQGGGFDTGKPSNSTQDGSSSSDQSSNSTQDGNSSSSKPSRPPQGGFGAGKPGNGTQDGSSSSGQSSNGTQDGSSSSGKPSRPPQGGFGGKNGGPKGGGFGGKNGGPQGGGFGTGKPGNSTQDGSTSNSQDTSL